MPRTFVTLIKATSCTMHATVVHCAFEISFITYFCTVAQRVTSKETWEVCDVIVKVVPFQRKRDAVQAMVEDCTPENTIVIEDVPEGIDEDHLAMYLEKVTKLDEDEFTVKYKGTKALMVLQGDVEEG